MIKFYLRKKERCNIKIWYKYCDGEPLEINENTENKEIPIETTGEKITIYGEKKIKLNFDFIDSEDTPESVTVTIGEDKN